MVVIMTNATALNLRMTLHSNFGLGVATITVGFVPRSLSKVKLMLEGSILASPAFCLVARILDCH